MASKLELHHLVDALPEQELEAAYAYLSALCGHVGAYVGETPTVVVVDSHTRSDLPESPSQEAAWREFEQDVKTNVEHLQEDLEET